MKLLFTGIFCGLLICLTLSALAIDWRSPANMAVVGAKDGIEKECVVVGTGNPGNLYYPDEPVTVTLAVPAKQTKPLDGAQIAIVGIHNRMARPGETGILIFSDAPQVWLTAQPEVKVPLSNAVPADGTLTVTLPVPKEYGLYALVLERKDGTRTALGTVARVFRPTPRKGEIPEIMGEFNYGGRLNVGDWRCMPEEVAIIGERMGYTLARIEIHWSQPKQNGPYDFARIDALLSAMDAHGIKIVDTIGIHPEWSRPFGLGGICEEKYDPDFAKWVQAFTMRYWKGGKSGLWGIEFYNEPWEPRGISGWNNDSVRYRQLLQIIHDNAKAVTPGIKIMGTCSVMNTEDKLVSDGRAGYVQMLDILTDHYVTPRGAYGPQVAAKYGKISGETETWGASTEVLIPQFLSQFLACGNRFINPTNGDLVMDIFPGLNGTSIGMPKPAVVAISAWNAIVADRPFSRIAFTNHLPWLYQFGPDNDAVFVLYGKLQALASGNPRDVVWSQVAGGPDGTMTIADPKGALVVLDGAGNPVARSGKTGYQLPANRSTFYVSSPLGAAYVTDCVNLAKLDGLRHVEIIPATLTTPPSAQQPAMLPVTVHNLYNVPLTGSLTASSLLDGSVLGAPITVKLAAGETTRVAMPVTGMPADGLPVTFTVAIGGTKESWQEVVQYTGITHKTIPANDTGQTWETIAPVNVLRPNGTAATDYIERVWLPFIKHSDEPLPARRGDVRLAWDDKNLYIQAVVEAKQLQPRARLETWSDEKYFFSAADDAVYENLRKYERFVRATPRPWVKADVDAYEKLKSDPVWPEYAQYLQDHPEAQALVNAGAWPAQVYFDGKKRDPQFSLAAANHVYKADFTKDGAWQGDSFEFGFDMDPADLRLARTHDLVYDWSKVPGNFQSMPDTDYEFSAAMCTDGQPELWCLLAPGVPRTHWFLRAPHAVIDQHAVKDARVSIVNADGHTTYRLAIPWQNLDIAKPVAGMTFGFTFRFNDSKAGYVYFGNDMAATKTNNLTLHPYWEDKPSCTVRWALQP